MSQFGRDAGGVPTCRRPADDPEARVPGRVANDQDTQRYITAYGISQLRDVPEWLRSLRAAEGMAGACRP